MGTVGPPPASLACCLHCGAAACVTGLLPALRGRRLHRSIAVCIVTSRGRRNLCKWVQAKELVHQCAIVYISG